MITLETPAHSLTFKLAAVLNEKLETGTAMNALAHMSLGLGTLLGPDKALMCDYRDGSGISHSSISAYPYIILKGRPGKIREAVELARTQTNITVVDFIHTMTIGSYIDQLAKTAATPSTELEFYGAAFYGETEAVNALTKKFSLFR